MKYTVIIGCGRLGANLAGTLSSNGESVTIIDKTDFVFKKLPPTYSGMVKVGDGTDISVLKDVDVGNANAVIVVTNNDNINIFIAQLAKEYFKISQVIARLYDPDKELVYKEFGIDTISPALLSVKEISQILGRTQC
ncbi:MAG: TrkA family potassium uptake protein [Oscillospiraceae bacterium]|jgi:trk system potassium uptake protein TrkA|nr:TrkA family potassium uptake protein [Oscillospiraceae bacterium]